MRRPALLLFLALAAAPALAVRSLRGSHGVLQPASGVSDAVFPKPPLDADAQFARWLAHVTMYGVLATTKDDKERTVPISGIVSHSDGAVRTPTGRLFFLQTPMDELVANMVQHPAVSYTVSEAQLRDSCPEPQSPVCARATFIGTMVQLSGADEELARQSLFARHPEMPSWMHTRGHHFDLYELQVQEVHLLNWYGGMKLVSGEDFYAAQLPMSTAPSA